MLPELLKKFYYGSIAAGKELFIPLLAIMLILLVLAASLPFSCDEAFTFNHFTSIGIWESLSRYPAPNNHVFHSFLTAVIWKFFGFTHAELTVRFPALLFSACTLYFIFSRFLAGQLYAVILFALLFLFSPNMIEFAFQARGYSIQIFCAVTSYFNAGNIKPGIGPFFRQRLNRVLLLSVIGLFTSPAYLYVAVCIYLIFVSLHYRSIKKEIKYFFWVNIFYGLILILLYTPILMYEGLHTIAGNEFVVPLGWFTAERLLSYLSEIINYITLPFGLGFIVVLLFIRNFIKQKAYYNAYLLVVPVIMMCVLRQLPFERVFLPIGAILLIEACRSITDSNWFKKLSGTEMNKRYRWPAFLLVGAAYILSYYYFDRQHTKEDLAYAYSFKKIRDRIDGYDSIYTWNLGWDLGGLLSAHLKLKGSINRGIDTTHLREYDYRSAIIISGETLPGFKLLDSSTDFEKKPILIYDPHQLDR